MKGACRLVAFDFDRVLVDTIQLLELAKAVGAQDQVIALMREWEAKLDSPRPYHIKAVGHLKGLEYAQAVTVSETMPLMTGAVETTRVLKSEGIKMAIITNGYYITAESVKQALEIEYLFANELLFDRKIATGEFKGMMGDIDDDVAKVHALETIANLEGITLDECAAVGDGMNDYPMMKASGLSIAFNADPRLERLTDVVIRDKDLRKILPFVLYQ